MVDFFKNVKYNDLVNDIERNNYTLREIGRVVKIINDTDCVKMISDNVVLPVVLNN